MRKYGVMLLLVSFALTLTTCRKGEKDPALSLRSRKARLTGKWHMTGGTASFKGGNIADSYVFDGSGFRLYVTPTGGTPTIYIGNYTLDLEIKGDGTFSVKENSSADKFEATGSWRFNKGIGETKKKECVIFQIDNITKGYIDYMFFNLASNCFEYKLTELRSKEIIIVGSTKTYAEQNSKYVTLGTTYTLTQH